LRAIKYVTRRTKNDGYDKREKIVTKSFLMVYRISSDSRKIHGKKLPLDFLSIIKSVYVSIQFGMESMSKLNQSDQKS
jgi:hypothetical protein